MPIIFSPTRPFLRILGAVGVRWHGIAEALPGARLMLPYGEPLTASQRSKPLQQGLRVTFV